MKKLTLDDLKVFRDRLQIPITDADMDAVPAAVLPPRHGPRAHPVPARAPARARRRRALRRRTTGKALELPGDAAYDVVKRGSGKQQIATTMAFVRLLKDLMRDKEIGPRIVPIIPDEARTFGMDSFFPTAKIYNPHGQTYTSVDRELMLAYKESTSGQILHEGINEAGSVAAFTAAGSSYATHGEPMIPIYIFYSMFGFQRTGDAFWAAVDQMARGFVIGATAGRTTLTGEGLQHADGHSPLLAATNPAVVAYDPAYGYELGHIVRDGLRRMYGDAPRGRLLLPDRLQRAERAAGRAGRASTSRASCAASTCSRPPATATARARSCSPPASRCRGRSRPSSCCATTGACPPTSGRSRRGPSCAATASPSTGTTCSSRRRHRARRTSRSGSRGGPARSSASRTTCARCRTRSGRGSRPTTPRSAPTAWACPTPRGALRRHFLVDAQSIVVRTLASLAERGEIGRDRVAAAIAQYQLDDPAAADAGNTEGAG